jgi:hypothetical protein
MGGGSSGTQTVVQQNQIPQYQQDYAVSNENLANSIAAQPYQPYQGQRIADFSPLQLRALQQIQSNDTGSPLSATYNQAIKSATGARGADPNATFGQQFPTDSQFASRARTDTAYGPQADTNSQFGSQADTDTQFGSRARTDTAYGPQANTGVQYGDRLTAGDVAPWMSPFVEQALQPQLQDIARYGAMNSQRINAGAAGAGAFGDARLGVQQGENDRNTGQIMSNAIGTGYQNAYTSALGAAENAFGQNAGQFNVDRASNLAALQSNRGQYNADRAAKLAALGFNAGQFNTDRTANLAALGFNAGQFNTDRAANLAGLQTNMGQYNADRAAKLGALGFNAGQFNTDRTANLAALQANRGQYNTEQTQGLAARASNLSAADEMARLAAAKSGYQQSTSNDLLGAGKMQQDLQQQGLTTAYQDYINQLQYPQEMLNLRLATQAGSPYNTTRLTTTPYSPAAQGIGALSALYGLVGKPAGGA